MEDEIDFDDLLGETRACESRLRELTNNPWSGLTSSLQPQMRSLE